MEERPDSTLSFVLAEIRADRREQKCEQSEFRREMQSSMRAARLESQDFREDLTKRVQKIEFKLAVENATKSVLADLPKSKTEGNIIGMNPVLVKALGGLVVAALGALAVSNALPAYTAILSALAAGIAGWLGLPRPGEEKKIEDKIKAELEQLSEESK